MQISTNKSLYFENRTRQGQFLADRGHQVPMILHSKLGLNYSVGIKLKELGGPLLRNVNIDDKIGG